MSRVRIESFTISLDGYGAGPRQDAQNPLGVGGTALHEWGFTTRTFRSQVLGEEGGARGWTTSSLASVLLGGGERLFDGLDLPALGYAVTGHAATANATHVLFTRTGPAA